MSNVRVLPSEVIARIAAGEVVERPASVVKELMENSLDAGATRLEVHLRAGGKTCIDIRDDGDGIGYDDMPILFTRHATSKIRNGDDLDAILSFGFRGEALYSVSSVSEFLVKSRLRGSSEGWSLQMKGGVRGALVPVAMPSHGTHVRVEELFFNTPARKKFLRADMTEADQCTGVFLPYVLLHHDRHFVLTNNERCLYDLPAVDSPELRAATALGLDERHIIHLENGGVGAVRFRALLGDINIQRKRRDYQYVFVNGRPVQSKSLSFHVNDVYRAVMPEGVHPFFVILLTVPAEDVDVNIHPAKREVRIRDEGRVGSLLRRSVEQALMSGGGAKEVAEDIFPFEPVQPGMEIPLPLAQGIPAARMIFGPKTLAAAPPKEVRQAPAELFSAPKLETVIPAAPPAALENRFAGFAKSVADKKDEGVRERLLRARFMGTFIRKYHLFEEGHAIFIIDQHAAQERIMFEHFSAQMAAGQIEVERLLIAPVIRLSPREMVWWEQSQAVLSKAGYESDLIAHDAVALRTAPRVIPFAERTFRALLSEGPAVSAAHDILARRACRASVMSGDTMVPEQAAGQLKLLLACADPFACPHGRPVFIELKESFLDRQFLRTT